jgi:hypothetical protein
MDNVTLMTYKLNLQATSSFHNVRANILVTSFRAACLVSPTSNPRAGESLPTSGTLLWWQRSYLTKEGEPYCFKFNHSFCDFNSLVLLMWDQKYIMSKITLFYKSLNLQISLVRITSLQIALICVNRKKHSLQCLKI